MANNGQSRPFPPQTTDVLTLQVRDEQFHILASTLSAGSDYFRSLFFGPASAVLAAPARTDQGAYIVSADPSVFKHIVSYLETNTYPLLWSKVDGLDYELYARVLQAANYFQVSSLASWIKDRKYESVVETRIWCQCVDLHNAPSMPETPLPPNTIVTSTTDETIQDEWRCPRGHIGNAECLRPYSCWERFQVKPTPSKTRVIKVVQTLTTTTMRLDRLCP